MRSLCRRGVMRAKTIAGVCPPRRSGIGLGPSMSAPSRMPFIGNSTSRQIWRQQFVVPCQHLDRDPVLYERFSGGRRGFLRRIEERRCTDECDSLSPERLRSPDRGIRFAATPPRPRACPLSLSGGSELANGRKPRSPRAESRRARELRAHGRSLPSTAPLQTSDADRFARRRAITSSTRRPCRSSDADPRFCVGATDLTSRRR